MTFEPWRLQWVPGFIFVYRCEPEGPSPNVPVDGGDQISDPGFALTFSIGEVLVAHSHGHGFSLRQGLFGTEATLSLQPSVKIDIEQL